MILYDANKDTATNTMSISNITNLGKYPILYFCIFLILLYTLNIFICFYNYTIFLFKMKILIIKYLF